jgi:UDP-glucose-4-epimerase GalE
MRSVLVTGGAGYIGSHVVRALRTAGFSVCVADDLSNGHRDALPDGVTCDVRDITAPGALDRYQVDAVVHLAGLIQVGESVLQPERYHAVNVGGTTRVAELAAARKIPVVFSSTAAVYGEPRALPIAIDHPCAPANPYGQSKYQSERLLAERAPACALLRYFNAAGADAGLCERHEPETHLVPLAIDAALGKGPPLRLFGSNWPTPDGTCVRDYVHVMDLADAHARALRHLLDGGPSLTLNLGAGRGTSVRQVLDAVARATGRAVPHSVEPRRAGDVASLVADISAARAALAFEPSRSSIDQIVRDTLASRS